MHITDAIFRKAGADAGIDQDSLDRLWAALQAQHAPKAALSGINLAFYAGGLLIIGAATFFMSTMWAAFGSGCAFVISLIYAAALALLGKRLADRAETRRPGGILMTAAVCMTPLIMFAFEKWTGLWVDGVPGTYRNFYELIHGSWMPLEIATVVAGLVALRFVRFPFITLPVVFSLWYLSMDVVGLITYGKAWEWHTLQISAAVYGVAMITIAMYIDKRTREDLGFWFYLYGGIALNSAASYLWEGHEEPRLFLFAVFALLELMLSILVQRRALTVMGALGMYAYIGHLAYSVFHDSLLFSIVLSLLGLSIIFVAINYQKHEARLRGILRTALRLPAN